MYDACKLATYVRVYKCTQCTHHVNLEAQICPERDPWRQRNLLLTGA